MSRPVLVVDDHESAAEGLAVPLRGRYAVTVARTVAGALAALAATAFSVVVLDLALDVDASPLHRELLLRETPVVVVSGIEADAARGMARVWRASALLKPVTDEELLSAVASAAARSHPPETPTMPDPAPAPHAPTLAPPPPDPPLPPPPAVPAGDSVSPLAATNERVAIRDMETRRRLRLAMGLCVTGLTVLFELRGHAVPGWLVAALTVIALGVEGGLSSLRKRPAVAGGGAAALVALAVGGGMLGSHEAELVAALGAGAIPVVDEAVNVLKGVA